MNIKAFLTLVFLCFTIALQGQTWSMGGGKVISHDKLNIKFNHVTWTTHENGNHSRSRDKNVVRLNYIDAAKYYGFLEWRSEWSAFSQMWEAGYTKGKLDKYEYDYEKCPSFWHPKFEDVAIYSSRYYIGATAFRHCRFQIPAHGGLGFEYLSKGPFSHLAISASLKTRAVFYLTRWLGVYAGLTTNANFGQGKTGKSKEDEETKKYNFNIKFRYGYCNADAGITIML